MLFCKPPPEIVQSPTWGVLRETALKKKQSLRLENMEPLSLRSWYCANSTNVSEVLWTSWRNSMARVKVVRWRNVRLDRFRKIFQDHRGTYKDHHLGTRYSHNHAKYRRIGVESRRVPPIYCLRCRKFRSIDRGNCQNSSPQRRTCDPAEERTSWGEDSDLRNERQSMNA